MGGCARSRSISSTPSVTKSSEFFLTTNVTPLRLTQPCSAVECRPTKAEGAATRLRPLERVDLRDNYLRNRGLNAPTRVSAPPSKAKVEPASGTECEPSTLKSGIKIPRPPPSSSHAPVHHSKSPRRHCRQPCRNPGSDEMERRFRLGCGTRSCVLYSARTRGTRLPNPYHRRNGLPQVIVFFSL